MSVHTVGHRGHVAVSLNKPRLIARTRRCARQRVLVRNRYLRVMQRVRGLQQSGLCRGLSKNEAKETFDHLPAFSIWRERFQSPM